MTDSDYNISGLPFGDGASDGSPDIIKFHLDKLRASANDLPNFVAQLVKILSDNPGLFNGLIGEALKDSVLSRVITHENAKKIETARLRNMILDSLEIDQPLEQVQFDNEGGWRPNQTTPLSTTNARDSGSAGWKVATAALALSTALTTSWMLWQKKPYILPEPTTATSKSKAHPESRDDYLEIIYHNTFDHSGLWIRNETNPDNVYNSVKSIFAENVLRTPEDF